MESFPARLFARIRATNSRVCLGIDPRPHQHPLTHPHRFQDDPAQLAKGVVRYFRDIIEASEEVLACCKLQAAFFEVLGIPGLIAMAQLIADLKSRYIPVILDAKRGDIGITSAAYARAYLGDGVFGSDALTVNPYLGSDGLEPFIEEAGQNGRGLFVLVKTSNPGSRDFQDLELASGQKLYERVAEHLHAYAQPTRDESGYSFVGAVVGATHPRELATLRQALPHCPLLVPGYGSQGASAEDAAAAFDANGLGAIVNASRSLTYLCDTGDYAERSRQAVLAMRDALNEALERRFG